MVVPDGEVHSTAPFDIRHLGSTGQSNRDFSGSLAKIPRIFPDGNGLSTLGNAVERGMVTILTGHRNAFHPLRGQRGNDTTGGAVIGGNHGIDLVVIGRQDLPPCCAGRWLEASRLYRLHQQW